MRLLGLTSAFLLAILVAEVAAFATDDTHNVRRSIGEMRHVARETAQTVDPGASAAEKWATVSLAQPLFAPDRKPDAKISIATEEELPRLAGIITTPRESIAIFEPPGDVKPVLVQPGQTVGGWKLTAVSGDTVDLERGGHSLSLAPQYKSAIAGNMARRVVRPPPRWEVAAESGLLRARWSNPHLQP